MSTNAYIATDTSHLPESVSRRWRYDSILDGDDDETITILSDKEYEEFYNEACKSITEKLKK